jgi:hypothetical protein
MTDKTAEVAVPSETAPSEKVLSMAEIEAGDDIEYTKIPAYKPGQCFCIGSLTAGDLIEWSEANETEAKRTAGLRLIVKSLVDGIPGENGATGKRIATEKDIATFRKKSHKVTERIVREILKLNGMNVPDTATKNA